MVTITNGAAIHGVDASLVVIETTIVQGTNFYVVGLPDNAIKESQHRIESVLKNTRFEMPRQRVIINLAPADIRKEGAAYDLPIALSILNSSHQCCLRNTNKYMILGELALDGTLRPIKGVLPMAILVKDMGLDGLILPYNNADEASIVRDINVFPMRHIVDAIKFLSGQSTQEPYKLVDVKNDNNLDNEPYQIDLSDIQGQENSKRALEIAAAGGHNIIMIGPPGSGKTMLAKRIPTILSPMTFDESLETTKIYSIIGKLNGGSLITMRPFRAPHHTISNVALVGGGTNPQPGEISLAHNGVLFLDELPEFMRNVLETMRQPLEEHIITISRAKLTITFPANFILIASMNPCPCGYYNHPTKKCVCTPMAVQNYLNKISGPLLDRIDIHIEITPVSFDNIINRRTTESSKTIQNRVIKAREIQLERFKDYKGIHNNAMMPSSVLNKICIISPSCQTLLKDAMEKLCLSARAYDKILKVSRTIADLDNSESIKECHIAEAIHYRSLDRNSLQQ